MSVNIAVSSDSRLLFELGLGKAAASAPNSESASDALTKLARSLALGVTIPETQAGQPGRHPGTEESLPLISAQLCRMEDAIRENAALTRTTAALVAALIAAQQERHSGRPRHSSAEGDSRRSSKSLDPVSKVVNKSNNSETTVNQTVNSETTVTGSELPNWQISEDERRKKFTEQSTVDGLTLLVGREGMTPELSPRRLSVAGEIDPVAQDRGPKPTSAVKENDSGANLSSIQPPSMPTADSESASMKRRKRKSGGTVEALHLPALDQTAQREKDVVARPSPLILAPIPSARALLTDSEGRHDSPRGQTTSTADQADALEEEEIDQEEIQRRDDAARRISRLFSPTKQRGSSFEAPAALEQEKRTNDDETAATPISSSMKRRGSDGDVIKIPFESSTTKNAAPTKPNISPNLKANHHLLSQSGSDETSAVESTSTWTPKMRSGGNHVDAREKQSIVTIFRNWVTSTSRTAQVEAEESGGRAGRRGSSLISLMRHQGSPEPEPNAPSMQSSLQLAKALQRQQEHDRVGQTETADYTDLEKLISNSQTQVRCFMLSGNSPARRTWDLVMLLLVLYTVCEVPFDLAFLGDRQQSTEVALEVLDSVMTIMFVVDLVSQFNTSFQDGEEEIYDRLTIARRYIGGPWFWIDLLSCLPVWLIKAMVGNGMNPSMLKGLKLFRMIRVGKMLKYFDDLAYASAFRIMRLLLFVVIMLHWSACAWAMVMSTDFQIANGILVRDCTECGYDGIEIDETDSCCTNELATVSFTYASTMYIAVNFVLGLGSVIPISTPEKYFACALSIYGAILQACVFGSVAVLIGSFDADDAHYQQKLTHVAQRMRQIGLPLWLRKRVLAYYDMLRDLENCGHGQSDTDTFLTDLSPSLQADIKVCLFRSMISKVPFFSNSELSNNFIEDIVMRMKTLLYLPGDILIRKGERADWIGFIGKSGVVIVLDPTSKTRRILKVLGEGDYVGEIALVYKIRRSTDVEAFTWTRLHQLEREDFQEVR
jgi:hypothetical protein